MKEIYLDNAATSWPKPESVIRAMENYFHNIGGSSGRSGHRRAIQAGRLVLGARSLAAEVLGVRDDSKIIFTSNTTSALNLVISGIFNSDEIIRSSHAVTTTMEHNSVLRPLNRLASRGLKVTHVPGDSCGRVSPEAVGSAITDTTKLVVVTHASNICGTVNDVEAISRICREKAVPLLVDGAQSAGVVPLDLESIDADFFACAGHKGLLGPQGTGLLYVKDKDGLDAVVTGGTGSLSDSTSQPDFLPDKFESGTPNIIGLAGLAEGCRFLLGRGVDKILDHDRRLMDILLEQLYGTEGLRIYGAGSSLESTGVLSVNIDGLDSSEAGQLLEQNYGLQTRIGLHCAPEAHKTLGSFPHGTVRLSWGWSTSEKQITRAARALKAAVATGRRGA